MFRYANVNSLRVHSNKKVLTGRISLQATPRSRYPKSGSFVEGVPSLQGLAQMHSRVLRFIDEALR